VGGVDLPDQVVEPGLKGGPKAPGNEKALWGRDLPPKAPLLIAIWFITDCLRRSIHIGIRISFLHPYRFHMDDFLTSLSFLSIKALIIAL
jgi:hypothetical protein